MWQEYIEPASIDEVLHLLEKSRERARIVAGATDLMLELERGVRTGIKTLIDITRLGGLREIRVDAKGVLHIGALVTHNDCVASRLIQERAFPLAKAAWEVGAPQIRNRGTVAGNLITASPANDTITPLIAFDASVVLGSIRGRREVRLRDFYTGVRKTVMEPDEMLLEIAFPAMEPSDRGTFLKLALRRAQAISLVNVAVVIKFKADEHVREAAIALGAVAPTILRAPNAEEQLVGRALTDDVIERAAMLARDAGKPIDDIRGSASYRSEMIRVLTRRALRAIGQGTEKIDFPSDPILLRGQNWAIRSERDTTPHPRESASRTPTGTPIETKINGQNLRLLPAHPKSLLRLLREDAGLTGTKEGCAEGECGACTVFLDGEAVMACLVPAPRAHHASIVTIEGLSENGTLHPVQKAFIADGAVQCGYCTPGFVMSSAKLLEERSRPQRNEIEQALAGNLCRCTGYYKIIQAVEDAGAELALEVAND